MPAAVALTPLLAVRSRVQQARSFVAVTTRADMDATGDTGPTTAARPGGGIVIP
ncbi:MAG TPA: hypothetical protein VE979_05065 [Streptosporangiaceae bacterium]|nr:hypothetical protein [Streptosporangiaceae bacterium]